LRLEKAVAIEEDAALTAAGKRGAHLAVHLESETVETVWGDPVPPMSREDVLAKFARYARRDGAEFLDADPGAVFAIPA
jgi:hypothetical protein